MTDEEKAISNLAKAVALNGRSIVRVCGMVEDANRDIDRLDNRDYRSWMKGIASRGLLVLTFLLTVAHWAWTVAK